MYTEETEIGTIWKELKSKRYLISSNKKEGNGNCLKKENKEQIVVKTCQMEILGEKSPPKTIVNF